MQQFEDKISFFIKFWAEKLFQLIRLFSIDTYGACQLLSKKLDRLHK